VLVSLFYSRPLLDDIALGIDDHAGADRTLDSLPVHHLLTESAILFHYVRFRIGQKHKRQIKFIGKLLMRINSVFTDAQNNRSAFFYLRIQLAEPASFFGSARRTVLWVEKQNNLFAPIILKRVLLAVIAWQTERRCFLSLQTLHALPSS
jgi:hypothetical protein